MIIQRFLSNTRNETISRQEYPEEIREFCVTLFYYSPKAYEYVRAFFGYALPASSTVRRWLANTEVNPGFLLQSFSFLKELGKNRMLMCALIWGKFDIQMICSVNFNQYTLDEVHLHEEAETSRGETFGFVDLGGLHEIAKENPEKLRPLATQALVYMTTNLNKERPFKLPTAYYLIKSMNAIQRKQIVRY
jgi:hypothetical protein